MTNGNFFHTIFVHLHASQAFVFQSPPTTHMPDIINMPIHSFLSLHPLLFLCGAASEEVIWRAHHALISVWIWMLSVHSVLCHSKLGENGNVAILSCLSCELAAFMIGFWGDRSKHLRGVYVALNIITRKSQPSAVFPCLVVVNLSGIHSNTTEFNVSN